MPVERLRPGSGAAAAEKLGRLPLRQSAARVNWLTASTPPPVSRTDRFIRPAASSKMRKLATLRASSSASALAHAVLDAQEHQEPGSDPRDHRVVDADLGLAYALQ